MQTWNEVFAAVILPLLSALIGLAVVWLRKKTTELSAKIENETAQKYINLASNAVVNAVQYTAQTYVDSLKKAGKFDVEAQREAFEQARTIAESMITKSARDVIAEAYGDFSTWIETQIEAAVKANK